MVLISKYSDRIHRRTIFLLQLLHRLFQSFPAGIVFSVGYHEQHFSLQLGILKVVRRSDYGFIERRSTLGVNLLQRLFQFQQVVGEILIEIIFVVEIHHKHFVLRIARPHQVQRCLVHLGSLFPHRAGIVDHDPHGHGYVFMPERNNILRFAVFQDGKRIPVKVGHNVLPVVHHRGVEQNLIHILAENKYTVLVGSLLLGGTGRRLRFRA